MYIFTGKDILDISKQSRFQNCLHCMIHNSVITGETNQPKEKVGRGRNPRKVCMRCSASRGHPWAAQKLIFQPVKCTPQSNNPPDDSC